MFTGIYAPIATPFSRDEINYDALAFNLERYSASPLAGVVVLGSNGEVALLNLDEKMRLIEFVRHHIDASKKVMAGTGCESTRDTIRLTRFAASVGADAVLVLTPHFYKGAMTDEALEKYFLEVAEASPLPVMLYNMPRNTGLNMSSALIKRLALHPNIVGVKDSGGNIVQITEVIAGTPADFAVFAGSGSFLYPTLAVGGHGGTLAVANIMPEKSVELYDAVRAGDHDKARQLQQLLLAPNAAVTTRWGVAGLKVALDLLGYKGGAPRRPLLPLKETERPALENVLRQAELL